MVYTAEHLSLAMIEYLAHLNPDRPPADLQLAQAEIPADVSRIRYKAEDLPLDWRRYPAPEHLANLGSEFIAEAKYAILMVPSVLATVEYNWLLNPAHQDFQRIRVLPTEPFQYDTRLTRPTSFISLLAGKTRKIASLDEINEAAEAGWAGQK